MAGRIADLAPFAGLENLHCRKPGLVAHLAAARHPVAKVDVRQPRLARDGDVVKDDVGPKAHLRQVGVVKAVDHRQPVIEHIGQADGGQRAAAFPLPRGAGVFDDTRFDRRLLDHRGEFEDVHVGHAAIGVAAVKVAAKQGELVFGGPGAGGVAAQGRRTAQDAALGFRGHEIRHPDARRQAGRAFGTRRAVEHVLAAPEALFGQRVIQPLRLIALQRGEQLSFHAPDQIGARLRGRHVELGRDGQGVAHLGKGSIMGLACSLASPKPSAKVRVLAGRGSD